MSMYQDGESKHDRRDQNRREETPAPNMLAHPLLPCPGAAHDNEAHVDNCNTCSPLWGYVPAYRGMSSDARWTLRTLAAAATDNLVCPNMPDAVLDACHELEAHGYVAMVDVTNKHRVNFNTYRLTPLGIDAARNSKA